MWTMIVLFLDMITTLKNQFEMQSMPMNPQRPEEGYIFGVMPFGFCIKAPSRENAQTIVATILESMPEDRTYKVGMHPWKGERGVVRSRRAFYGHHCPGYPLP